MSQIDNDALKLSTDVFTWKNFLYWTIPITVRRLIDERFQKVGQISEFSVIFRKYPFFKQFFRELRCWKKRYPSCNSKMIKCFHESGWEYVILNNSYGKLKNSRKFSFLRVLPQVRSFRMFVNKIFILLRFEISNNLGIRFEIYEWWARCEIPLMIFNNRSFPIEFWTWFDTKMNRDELTWYTVQFGLSHIV